MTIIYKRGTYIAMSKINKIKRIGVHAYCMLDIIKENIVDNVFIVKTEDIAKKYDISPYLQARSFKVLEQEGLIAKKLSGIPPRIEVRLCTLQSHKE